MASCADSFYLPTPSSLMSSLSSNLPISASFLPWCQRATTTTTSTTSAPSKRNSPLQLPSIQSFGQYHNTPATQWRDSSYAFDSYESSPIIPDDNSSPPSPMEQSHPATPATNVMLPPYLPTTKMSSSSSSSSSLESATSATAGAANQWFWVGPHPSAQAIAEKTCEMVCYLWFSNTLGAPKSSPHYRESTVALRSSVPSISTTTVSSKRTLRSNSSSTGSSGTTTTTSTSTPSSSYSLAEPLTGLSDATTAALQFAPSSQFINFMQKLLQTTQVSQSVIVLSLHYIYRLKEENHFTNGKPGSEFRVAVVALMLANKFIDDNTYTNKTWSEVSGIELQEINKMEREFLRGVAFRLYVNTDTYKAWVNLLEGLVAVKERDQRQWHYSRRYNTSSFHAPVPRLSTSSPSSDCVTYPQPRARSSSPLPSLKASYPFTFVAPSFTNPFSGSEAVRSRARPPITPPSLPGVKRPAIVAFSPPSATLQGGPTKRPISLNMSLVRPTQGPVSAGSAYPLSAFAQLSLNKPNNAVAVSSRQTPSKSQQQSMADSAQTLAAPYTLQDRGPAPNPQHLYYYTLASSPTHCEGDNRVHKALLRSHLPPTYQPVTYLRPPAPIHPTYTHSASASPVHPSLPSCRYLPSYHPPTATTSYPHPVIHHSGHPSYVNNNPHHHHHQQLQQHHLQHHHQMDSLSLPPIRIREPSSTSDDDSFSSSYIQPTATCQPPSLRMPSRGVPIAPFANAGPPGVHHWPSAQAQYTQPLSHHVYPHTRYSMGQI